MTTTGNGLIDAGKLTKFAAAAFEKMGIPAEDALITAQALVAADLRGVDSHGTAHLGPFYIKRIKDGLVNAKPNIKITSRASSTAVMDGDKGLGFVIGYRAMEEAMRRAEATGTGFVAVRNSTHYGAGAYYAMMALKKDMIGISLTQGGKGVVAPGSKGRGLGLNVISVAVPAKEEAPFVLDMATGVVANGKLEVAARNKRSIPVGWAVDIDNNPVTEVSKVTGGILPLGGLPETGSFKGFGLTVLVDILCSTLSSWPTVPELSGQQYTGQASHFFGAISINGFLPAEQFKANMDNMIRAHHNLPKAAGVDRIYMCGEIEQEIENKRKKGLPLHPDIVASLQTLAQDLNLKYEL
jgi:L-2-hydroxycarboxylate dehydrogenase (NAD+)